MNRATIQPTKFENVRTGEISYGVRVYDNYGQTYDNCWENIPDDDMEVLQMAMELEDQAIVAILHEVVLGNGVYIGQEWYTWDQIKHLWGDED